MSDPRPLLRVHAAFALTSDTLVLDDGSIWSHAATLGAYYKGSNFTIDRPFIENAIRVFTSGYPQKINVDYEHASTTNDPEVRKLRAQGRVPSAGQVLELRGVYGADDFTGDLKTAAEKLSTIAGRGLDDPKNLGMWMRWVPTANALNSIKAREHTELSIAFDDDLPNNTDGKGQGPALVAVALCNMPFLDGMLPVAASRYALTHEPDSSHQPGTEMTTNAGSNIRLLSLVGAVRSKAVSTDEEAITELTAIQTEVTELRALAPFRDVVAAEFSGEKDPAKIATQVRELRAKVATAEQAAKDAKAKELKATVDATMEKYKNKLTVPDREIYAEKLTAELEAGAKIADTKVVKALEARGTLSIFSQDSAADVGGAGAGDDVKIAARADELLEKDASLKALSAKDWPEAYRQATSRAVRELSAATA